MDMLASDAAADIWQNNLRCNIIIFIKTIKEVYAQSQSRSIEAVVCGVAAVLQKCAAVNRSLVRLQRHRCLPHSSSASRCTAGAAGFLLLTQCRERPER